MRHILIITLASLFIIAGTELHEFLRIPFLLVHYREHRQEKQSLTMFEFLKLHYLPNHPNDKDEGEDDDLPFKSAGAIHHLDITMISFREPAAIPFTLAEICITHHNDGVPRQMSFSIFHPPRNS